MLIDFHHYCSCRRTVEDINWAEMEREIESLCKLHNDAIVKDLDPLPGCETDFALAVLLGHPGNPWQQVGRDASTRQAQAYGEEVIVLLHDDAA